MKRILTATAIATALGTAAIVAAPSFAGPGPGAFDGSPPQLADGSSARGGWYGHGPGMMMGGGMGYGQGYGMMMGGGMGYGQGSGTMMGYGPGGGGDSDWCHGNVAASGGDLDLSAADVKKNLERYLAWAGNKRLQVGEIKKDGDDFIADIVTKENSLVERLKIDGDSGFTRRID